MSAAGRAELIRREGFRTTAYRDSVGVWTIGVGHTAAAGPPVVKAGMKISKQEVDVILSRDLEKFEKTVNTVVEKPISQGQFDALCSLCFNIGPGAFARSTTVRRLNAGNFKGAADAFMMWVKPPALRRRRLGERQQFLDASQAQRVIAAADAADAIDEVVTADYLRLAGSRTIVATDRVKVSVGGVVAAATAASAAITQAGDVVAQARDLAGGFEAGAGLLDLARSYWPLAVIGACVVASAWFAWRAWAGAMMAESARVDDANTGVNTGR
jgi:GH24 family phage-related lysozyme (muramidase)